MSDKQTKVYLNSNYSIILINRVYLKKILLNAIIKKMLSLISIREVDSKIVHIDKYTQVEIYVYNTINDQVPIDIIVIKIYIVDDLKINLLIDNNILKL